MPKLTLVAACLIAAPAIWGQSAVRTFDVVAIKAHARSSLPDRYIRRTDLGLSACTTVFGLIRVAYDVQQYQITEGPSWINSQYWDIAAKTETAIPTQDWPAFFVELLHDRFQLKVRRETQNVAGYALTGGTGPVKLGKAPPAPPTPSVSVAVSGKSRAST